MVEKNQWKRIPVIDSRPNASKKGLRIKVESAEVDENGVLKSLYIDHSDLGLRGSGYIYLSGANNIKVIC